MGTEAALGEAEAGGAEVVTPRAIALARESFGAEPVEGEVAHYDLKGNRIGRSILQEGRSQTFDSYGRKDGYSVRYQWGSRGWDRSGKYVGYTRVDGNISRGYDAEGKPDGFSQRVGDKAYAYDAQGRYTGYSIIRPLRTVSGPTAPLIPLGQYRCPQGTHMIQRGQQYYCTPDAVAYYSPYRSY
jgi:YD repeat-containing protein